MESGVINGERKTLHRGKAVVSFVLGTQRLFDYIHENPAFEFRPISYTNDPFVVAQNERMVAINGALQVDMTGQVCADSLGTRPYSGFGGQIDFIRGAARSKGGVPIIALPSTARGGTVSRIVPVLEPGAGVVTSRADVHYVVTEHGVAYLHGKTLRERAEALIAIADPRFQAELEDFAVRAHYMERKRGSSFEWYCERGANGNDRSERAGAKSRIGASCGSTSEECKGCGLCIEACPPKVIGAERAAESLRLPHGGVCGRRLHGLRHLLHGVPGAGGDYGAAAGACAEAEASRRNRLRWRERPQCASN